MNLVTIIAAISLQTSANLEPPVQLDLANGITATELHVGGGKVLEEGDKITIQYRVWDSLNRVLADSKKRGLPFTLVYGKRNSDPLISVALAGMHSGGIRTATIPAELVPEGIGSIVPPKTDLHLWIYVIAAKTFRPSGGDTFHVERTQGVMEIPRAIAHHGSTRTQDSL